MPAVKKVLLKISIIILLAAVAAEMTSSLWMSEETGIVFQENEDKGENKKADIEKEDVKDKLFKETSAFQSASDGQTIFILQHTWFKYTAYLSLPDIPPELS